MEKKKLKLKKIKLKKDIPNDSISQFKSHWKKGNAAEKILTIIMGFLVLGFTMCIVFFLFVVISAPPFDAENLYTKESSIILDAAGNEIARLGTENRERVTYDQLPEVFVDALIATEDSRFFQHSGVDMARFAKATIGQLLGNSGAGGASTLTMQVVKQRYTDSTAEGLKGIIRKFTDIYMAVFKLEKNYTKEQIIEYYVNIPGLGSGTFGIEQASETYFGKPIGELTLSEAALIAGLFQAPSAYNPFSYPEKAEARRNQVLTLMKRHGYISEEECELAKSISVESLLVTTHSSVSNNQGFIDTVVEDVYARTKKDPYLVSMKIHSTLIQEKQDVINNINNGTTYKWPNETLQTGIAVIDVDTGALVAVGAGRNKKSERSLNYATMIKKHPGSTAKPIFDYGPAIEYLNWSTGQTLVDDQYTYSNGASIKNWNNTYEGIMTAKKALASSRNIPALETFQQLSQEQIKTFVTNLGITPEYDKAGYINESHSIGGFTGTNALEMAAAYATFARGGIYIEPYSFTSVEFLDSGETYTVTPEKRTVMAESTAYMINMILKYAVTNSYVTAGSKSGTDVASKTGTSTVDSAFKESLGIKASIIGDSWQMVYSPDYVCGVWVGYENITSTQYLTNSMGGTVKKAIVKQLTSGILEPNSRWKQPSSVVSATVELETNPLTLASEFTPEALKSVEYFKKGTVPSETSTRFSKLETPTNLKATSNNGTVTLTWKGIDTPEAINQTFLENYFKEGYKTFADKYLQKRLEYNAANIGSLGYHVYITANGSTTDLGFTTSTSYKYNGVLSGNTTFTVKSAYSIFKANMSSGATATIETEGTTTPSRNWSIELNGSKTLTVQGYYNFINLGNYPITVKNNGIDVTSSASIANECWDENDNEANCATLDCKHKYTISHTATYNNEQKSVTRKLNPGC